jgi:hypothetical protein
MDGKSDLFGKHLLNGTLYSSATASSSLDMARFKVALVHLSISAVASDACVFIIQDSADNVTFTNTSFQYSEPVASTNNTRFLLIREQDVRRYVRVRIAPAGTITMSASATQVGTVRPAPITTFSIDTSA